MIVRYSEKDLRVFDSNSDTGVTLMEWSKFIDENDLYTRYYWINFNLINIKVFFFFYNLKI